MKRNILLLLKPILITIVLAVTISTQARAQTAPVIQSFTPASAAPGETVTITGTAFNTTVASNLVRFGGLRAVVTGATATSLTVTVPAGATHAPITLQNTANGLSATSSRFFLPTFSPGKRNLESTDFVSQGTRSNGLSGNSGLAHADLDGDGKLDLITTDYIFNSFRFTVQYNNSTASTINFNSSVIAIPGANRISGPSAGDLDGDGLPDIVVTSANTNEMYVIRNTGDPGIRFAFAGNYGVGEFPGSTSIGDVDGDGRNDVVVTGINDASVSIFLNTSTSPGTITFAPRIELTEGSHNISRSIQIALADLNNDGKPEIILPKVGANVVHVLKNNSTPGDVNFSSADSYMTSPNVQSPYAHHVAFADLDSDGKTDLVVSNIDGTYKGAAIFRNTSTDAGNITFAAMQKLDLPEGQYHTAVGDLNGDGKPDLMFNVSFGQVALRINTTVGSTITFGQGVQLNVGALAYTGLIADLTGDGRPDLLAGQQSAGVMAVYQNNLQYPPSITSIVPETAAPGESIVITGTNFDNSSANNSVSFGGIAAPVTGGSTTSLTVTVPAGAVYGPVTVTNTANRLSGSSQRAFRPAFSPNKTGLIAKDFSLQGNVALGGNALYGMASADFNGDGKADVLATDRQAGTINILPNTSTGTTISFGTPFSRSVTTASIPAVGDLNGDGKPDVVIPSNTTDAVHVMLNNSSSGTLNFHGTQSFPTGTGPNGAAVGDLDGDGFADIVTVNFFSKSVSVLRNIYQSGTLAFAPKVDLQLISSTASYQVRLTDLDGDGKLDIITQCSSSTPGGSRVRIFKNASTPGNISFAAPLDLFSSDSPSTITTGDLNGDNKPEIIVTYAGESTISVFENTSTSSISFAPKQDLAGGGYQSWTSVGDLNGDGKPDIVVSMAEPKTWGQNDYYLTVFNNTSVGGSNPITFAAPIDLITSTARPHASVIGDFDGDGRPDILSGNSDDHNITLFRNNLITVPTTQASAIVVTLQSATSTRLSWTNGNGQKRVVFMKQAQTGSPAPADATDYTANAEFGSGTQIGTSGWYAVYAGTGSSVTVTGLSSLSYQAAVMEYNDNSVANAAVYQTATATNNPVNFIPSSAITSINRNTAASTNASSVKFTVELTQAVTGLSTSNFDLTTTGVTGASVSSVTGSGTTYEVTVTTGTGDGTITLNLANDTGLSKFINATLPFAGQTYTIDKTTQPLSVVKIASNNANAALAAPGDQITLTLTAAENINTPVVTIAGQNATVTGSGLNWTATYTLTTATANGIVGFTTSISDLLDNTAATTSSTTDASQVTFDKTLPVLNTVTLASSHTNPLIGRTGDVITLSIIASETIQTPVVTIAGQSAAVTGSGATWTATYTLTSATADGAVPFTVNFKDPSGNAGTTVTATTNSSSVTVDNTLPVLTTLTITSNNAALGKAKAGDVINLSIIASETIQTPVVTIAGQSAVVSGSGATWTAAYTLTSATADGAVSFTVNFTDLSGNSGAVVTATTNNSSVTVDNTSPVLNTVVIASSHTNPSKAKPGDIVTLSFSSSEAISSPVISIGGQSVPATGSGTAWTSTYTVTSATAEGTLPFRITFSDISGNNGTAVSATTDNSIVTVDKTLPVLTTVALASSNAAPGQAKTGDVITLHITASEAINQPTVTIAGQAATVTGSGSSWTATYTLTAAITDGAIPFQVNFTDVNGNAGTTVTTTTNGSSIRNDNALPTLSTVAITSNNINPAKAKLGDIVTLSISASEIISSPVISIGGQSVPATGSGTAWTSTYTVTSATAEGTLPFRITFSDISGNNGTAVTATTDNSSVTVDKTLPVLTAVTLVSSNAAPGQAKAGDVITLNITASEAINQPTVTIAGQAATVTGSGSSWTATYTLTAAITDGAIPFQVNFTDLNGNAGAAVTSPSNGSSITNDNILPVLSTVAIASNNINPSKAKPGDIVTLSFSASEVISSPVVTIGDQSVPATGSGTAWTSTYTVTSATAEGTLPFRIMFSDISGNNGTAVTATTNNSSVTVDKTLPVLTAVALASSNAAPGQAKAGDVITLSFSASEAISSPVVTIGGQSVPATGSGTAWTSAYTVTSATAEGTLPFRITFSDISGNNGTAVTATTNNSSVTVDKTLPALTAVALASSNTAPGQAKAGDVITLHITASEAINQPTVTIAGQAATVTGSGSNWTATYTLTTASTDGPIAFQVNYTDLNGNSGTSVTTTTNGGIITIDNTRPILTAVTIASNNDVSGKAKPGDQITLSLSASEPISSPQVTVAGQVAIVTGSGTNWTARYTLTSSTADGNIAFTVNFSDVAGNAGAAVTTTTNNSAVDFDKTRPVFTAVSLTSSNSNPQLAKTGDIVTLNFTVNETVQTPVVTIGNANAAVSHSSGQSWQATYPVTSVTPSGSLSFLMAVTDLAGNTSQASATTDNSSVAVQQDIPSAIATLSALELNQGSLAPAFNAAVVNYSVNVDNAVTSITLKPSATDPAAVLRINGAVLGLQESYTLALATGVNVATIEVTSPNGMVKTNYNITVTRANAVVIINQPPTLNAIADHIVCPVISTQTVALSGISAGRDENQAITLTIRSDNPTLFDALTVSPGANGNGLITYQLKTNASGSANVTVTVTDNGGTQNGGQDQVSRTFKLTVDIPLSASISSNTGTVVSKGTTVLLTATGGQTYQWEGANGIVSGQNSATLVVRPSATTLYTVKVTNSAGCVSTANIQIHVNSDGEALEGTNVLTPNGDGRNDVFIVRNIDMYPQNKVIIFDRAGREVYVKTGYTNDWEGTYNGERLAEGTYYYIVYLGEGIKTLRGYISIINQ